MKLVMTLLVRDEADILDSHIAFHLNAGVDFIVATDHDSSDGTTEILERYAAQGVLHLLHESGREFLQPRWVTRMARLASTEFGADWVINSDADEFWWPSGGDLKYVVSSVPERFGILHTFVRPFLPRSGEGPFAERLVVRLSLSAPINDPSTSFRGGVRLCHRGSPDVIVSSGNAAVYDGRLVALRGWSPLEVLHFPIRSFEHFKRKFLSHHATVVGRRGDHVVAYREAQRGRLRRLYDERYASDSRLRRGLMEGTLTLDTRLRDALRRLNASPRAQLSFPARELAEDTRYAVEAAAIDEAELVRLGRRVDELERRIASEEARVGSRSARLGSSSISRRRSGA